MIRNGSVFFLGPGGSGKTCTLHALLREQPPSVRQSTPCAKRTVRTIAQCKVGVEGVLFIRIQDDQYSDMLSTTAKQLQPQLPSISTTTPPQAQSDKKQHQKKSFQLSLQLSLQRPVRLQRRMIHTLSKVKLQFPFQSRSRRYLNLVSVVLIEKCFVECSWCQRDMKVSSTKI